MSLNGTVKWVGLALTGIAIAIGVAFAATDLISQQVGIASEPVRAGEALGPPGSHGDDRGPGKDDRRNDDSTRDDSTGDDSTGDDSTGDDSTGDDSTGDDSTDDSGDDSDDERDGADDYDDD